MNRRRFMKLFGAAAAAGAVPAIAGTNAAIAYAEKQPVRVEDAFQRVLDACEELRKPMIEFARQATNTGFSAAKLDEAIERIRGNMGVPLRCLDLTPRYLLTSQARAAELRDLMSTKLAERGRVFETALSRQLNLGGIDLIVAPLMPRDHALIVDRFHPTFLESPDFARAIHEFGTRR